MPINIRNSPTSPPITESIIDSYRNCHRIKFLFAPRAFCIPIILVLSFTDTNIIFAIPKPPTRIEKPPIIHPPIFIPAKTFSNPCVRRLALFTEKLLSSPGFRRLEARSIWVVSSVSSSTAIPLLALTIIFASVNLLLILTIFFAKFTGKTVRSSSPLSLKPPSPSFLNIPITVAL